MESKASREPQEKREKPTLFLWFIESVGVAIVLYLDGAIYSHWPEPPTQAMKVIGSIGGFSAAVLLHLALIGLILLDTSPSRYKSNAVRSVIVIILFPFVLFALRFFGALFP